MKEFVEEVAYIETGDTQAASMIHEAVEKCILVAGTYYL